MNELISVIIPIYNVEKYLDECVKSVVTQTYHKLEIILVDDGSIDNSGRICDKWKEQDERVRVIHKKNGGLSSARNVGLKYATGNIVGFIDSDDYIKQDMYEDLMKYMIGDVEIVCCASALVNKRVNEGVFSVLCNPGKCKTYNSEEAISEILLTRDICFSPCDKIFKKSLFDNNRFPVGRLSEDMVPIYNCVKKSRKTVNIGQVKYFYRYRVDSICNRDFTLRRIDDVLFARDILVDVAHNYPHLEKEAEALYICSTVMLLDKIELSRTRGEFLYIEERLTKMLRRMLLRILINNNITDDIKVKVLKYVWD